MLRIIFYLPPFMVNIITGLLFFVPARRLAEADGNAVAVAGAVSAWAFAYTLASVLLGFFQNKKNAVFLILLGQTLSLAGFAGMIFCSDLKMQYWWMLLNGVATTLFYTPFQVIMDALEKNVSGLRALMRSTSFYTFSWSIGLAVGPIAAAGIWKLFETAGDGWKYCYYFCIFLNLVITIITMMLYFYIKKQDKTVSIAEDNSSNQQEEELSLPDFSMDGWAIGVCGYLTVYILRSLLPFRGEVIGFSTAQQGILIGMIAFMQAVTALCLYKSKKWMYKPFPVLVPVIGGLIGMGLAGTATNFYILVFAMFIYGIFSGVFAWLMIYHAIAIVSKRAKYVSVNETIVGLGGIISPLAGGFFTTAERSGLPFLVGAFFLLCAIIFHLLFCMKHRCPDNI